MRGQRSLLLVDERQEIDRLSIIIQSFERQVNMMILLVRSLLIPLLIEQFSKFCLLDVLAIHSLIISKHIVVLDDIDMLIVRDERLIVISAVFLYLLDSLPNEEPVLLLIELV